MWSECARMPSRRRKGIPARVPWGLYPSCEAAKRMSLVCGRRDLDPSAPESAGDGIAKARATIANTDAPMWAKRRATRIIQRWTGADQPTPSIPHVSIKRARNSRVLCDHDAALYRVINQTMAKSPVKPLSEACYMLIIRYPRFALCDDKFPCWLNLSNRAECRPMTV